MEIPFLRQSPVTRFLLLVIGAAFVLEIAAGGSTDTAVLVRLGANVPGLFWAGEYWRLATSVFLHIGFLHLLVNGWALYQLGSVFELLAGSGRLLTTFLITGLTGSLGSVLWSSFGSHANGVSAGASGAIFGLLGALIAFLLRRRGRLLPRAKALLSQLVLWAAINTVFGFTVPGIDNAAHMGGVLGGLLIGLSLRERRRPLRFPDEDPPAEEAPKSQDGP